jgi:hypothetical protein
VQQRFELVVLIRERFRILNEYVIVDRPTDDFLGVSTEGTLRSNVSGEELVLGVRSAVGLLFADVVIIEQFESRVCEPVRLAETVDRRP